METIFSEKQGKAFARQKSRIQVGQQLLIAPEDAPSIEAADMALEHCSVVQIPKAGDQIIIELEDGERCAANVACTNKDFAYLGTIDTPSGAFRFLFLTEHDFWEWWEWELLSTALDSILYDHNMGYCPTEKNIAIVRLLYDIVANENLDYQDMSCTGCQYGSEKGAPNTPCLKCRRIGVLEDLWQGKVSKREWLMRRQAEDPDTAE